MYLRIDVIFISKLIQTTWGLFHQSPVLSNQFFWDFMSIPLHFLWVFFISHNSQTKETFWISSKFAIKLLEKITRFIQNWQWRNPKDVTKNISKVFDRIWHAGLLHKLKSYGIPGTIFGLISSFPSNRRASGGSGWEVFTRIFS